MSASLAPAHDSALTFTDVFCGAGGSSIGLREAGFELRLAANHWARAIETHSANFPGAEHLCADVSNYDMRRLPRTRIGWFSPICTENSPAGGRKRRPKGQLDLLEEAGHVSRDGMERTRATFMDVIRATEVHRYDAVIVENVTEAADWELFDWWVSGMKLLGYNCQFVSVSSAHVGGEDNPHAPQWRDRLYIVFTRTGIPLPDVSPKPLAWCAACGLVVEAFQSWKRPDGRKIGKFGRQYVYRCPRAGCRHAVAEPFVLPAASAIDWSDLGARIGDRRRTPAKPEGLAPATIARIRAGLEMFGTRDADAPPFLTLLRSGRVRTISPAGPLAAIMASGSNHGLVLPVGGNNHDAPGRSTAEPMCTRVVRDTDALVTAPFLTMLRNNQTARPIDEPVPTVTTSGWHHGLTVPPFVTMLRGPANAPTGADEPLATMTTGRNHGLTIPPGGPFVVRNYGGYFPAGRSAAPVSDPLGTITATGGNHALVIPFRGKRSRPTTTGDPLHTMATRESAGLLQHDQAEIADCRFRMLKPREHLRAQRFPDSYIVTGNQGEQTMQAGNAVSANVAHWLGRQVAAVL